MSVYLFEDVGEIWFFFFFSQLFLKIIIPKHQQKHGHSSGIMAISNPAAVEFPNENFLCYYLTQVAFSVQRSPKTEQWERAS